MAMKKNVKPKNDTIDAAGKVVVSATKRAVKNASAGADAAEKIIIEAFKVGVDPVKFLKDHMGSKKAGTPGRSMMGVAPRKATKMNKPSNQVKKK
jgi:hypothetical protein